MFKEKIRREDRFSENTNIYLSSEEKEISYYMLEYVVRDIMRTKHHETERARSIWSVFESKLIQKNSIFTPNQLSYKRSIFEIVI